MTDVDPTRTAAMDQLERLRAACEAKTPDGQALIAALWHVARDHAPDWLRSAFFPRWQRILDADSLSLDEEFGRPWPKGTRRGSVRELRQARAQCHAAVWRIVAADPARPIDDGLFEDAGLAIVDADGMHLSGSTVRRRYREALEAGFLDVRALRS